MTGRIMVQAKNYSRRGGVVHFCREMKGTFYSLVNCKTCLGHVTACVSHVIGAPGMEIELGPSVERYS